MGAVRARWSVRSRFGRARRRTVWLRVAESVRRWSGGVGDSGGASQPNPYAGGPADPGGSGGQGGFGGPSGPGGPGDPGMGNGPGMPTGPYGEQPQGQPEQGKKKSPLMPILIIAAVVVLALGGVGVATFFGSDDDTVTAGQSSDDTDGADGSGSGSDRGSGPDRSGSGSDQVPAVGDCVVRLAETGERIDTLDFPEVVDCDDPGPMQTEYEGAITPCVDAGAPEATLVFQWGVADTYDSVEEYQRGICLVEAG